MTEALTDMDFGEPGMRPTKAGAAVLGAVAAGVLALALLGGGCSGHEPTHPQSVVVLPIESQDSDPSQGAFCEGLTRDLVTGLSRFPELEVTPLDATSRHATESSTLGPLVEDLGVLYALRGNARRAGDTISVRVVLFDAQDPDAVWEKEFKQPLANRERLVRTVAGQTAAAVRDAAIRHIECLETRKLTAQENVLCGHKHLVNVCAECNTLAREAYERAIVADPSYASAYVGLGRTYYYGFTRNFPPLVGDEALERAIGLFKQGIALGPDQPDAFAYLGIAEIRGMRFEEGMEHLRTAEDLNPGSAEVHYYLGNGYFWLGQYEKSIEEVKLALDLDPAGPANWYMRLAWSYYFLRQYDLAQAALDRGFDKSSDFVLLQNIQNAVYAERGQMELARESVAETLKLDPHYSISWVNETSPFKHQSDRDRFSEALRRAGVPE